MILKRVLEPEVMDSASEAEAYDTMDHAEVNRQFVADLLSLTGPLEGDVLDLGTGTAQIPVELCRQAPDCRVMAVDLSVPMLDLARYNIEVAGLTEQIQLAHQDAKQLEFEDGMFAVVISNSIAHHIADPKRVFGEAVRVTEAGGQLFFRDLMRPASEAQLQQLVATYAGDEDEQQQRMFAESLHAALNLEEIRGLVQQLGFDPETVQPTSDRHWTWRARRPHATSQDVM